MSPWDNKASDSGNESDVDTHVESWTRYRRVLSAPEVRPLPSLTYNTYAQQQQQMQRDTEQPLEAEAP